MDERFSAPAAVPVVAVASDESWPVLGLGTWRMGDVRRNRKVETEAVRTAIAMGYRLIDTAEMYGDGGAEEVTGAAIAASIAAGTVQRHELFVVSKVYPHHASARGVRDACRRSLERLGLDRLDAYLLHWRGSVPLAETVAGFEALRRDGLIRHWGVSNFDVDDLEELFALDGGARCAINQIYYSVRSRGPAFDLLPWHRRHGVVTMAYSPIDQGALAGNTQLAAIAQRHDVTPAQVALAWLSSQAGVMAIPKAVSPTHQRENLQAPTAVRLDADDMAAIDRAFPPPRGRTPLTMI